MTFSDILKELRTEKQLSQAEVAKVLGIAQSTYANYEIKNREPDFETLAKIADYFDVSTDYLLGKSSVRSRITTTAAHRADDFRKELPPEKVQEVEAFIQFQLDQHRKKQGM